MWYLCQALWSEISMNQTLYIWRVKFFYRRCHRHRSYVAIFPFFLSCFQFMFFSMSLHRDKLINLSIWCTRFYFALLSIKHTRSVCESGGWWVAWLAAQMKMDTKQMDLNQKLMEIHLCDMVFDMWFCCPSFYRLRKQTQARARTFANDFIAKSIAERGHTCTG